MRLAVVVVVVVVVVVAAAGRGEGEEVRNNASAKSFTLFINSSRRKNGRGPSSSSTPSSSSATFSSTSSSSSYSSSPAPPVLSFSLHPSNFSSSYLYDGEVKAAEFNATSLQDARKDAPKGVRTSGVRTILGLRGQGKGWGRQEEGRKELEEDKEEPTKKEESMWSVQEGGPSESSEGWVGVNEGRGWRWQGRRSAGRRSAGMQGPEEEEEDNMTGDMDQSHGEKRVQHASIRHRKSRRNFVRTRKSPKMRPRSHPEEDPTRTHDFEITWETEPDPFGHSVSSEHGGMDLDALGSTPISPLWSSSGAPNLENKLRATGDLMPTEDVGLYDEDGNLDGSGGEGGGLLGSGGRGPGEADVDVVTKFLRIVESQSLLGENCTKGTDFNLGEGVVDRYAQERFRLEGEIAVNRANLYTRLWKYSSSQVLASEYLLHAEVLTMVELDEDIFAAGNCYDKFEYQEYILFCPFAYRLPEGNILVKDLAVEYKYMSNTSEWFFFARKNAERAIRNYTHLTKGYHTYTHNHTAHTERIEEEILSVTYEDGRWTMPYFDCGGGNIWMMTYTVPFFGYANNTYYFKGTSGIDIDLRRVDIDQCPLPPGSTALNIFANSDKCKKRTTKCITIPGLGFRRGSYKCECRMGFFYPDTFVDAKYYNGSIIEEEYEKKIVGELSIYDQPGSYECLPCAEGCEECIDGSPCVVSLNWLMRTAILALSIIIILSLPVIIVFTWKYGNIKVVRAASPALLRIIILGAFFIYSTTLVLYPIPSVVTCTLRVWLREVGFSLSYGALMLKTWRISVIFRVRSAKAVKITDLDLTKRLGIIVGVFAVFLAIRTVVAPPQVIVRMTADDLKAYLCATDWWDHSFTAMEMMFLVWGIRLCIMVRKAPSEFNESKFISIAIYNEFLLSVFLNVSMLFLQSPANPDLLFIIFFCHTQLTITLLLALIFGSKAYLVMKGQGKGEESMSMTKPMAAKFLQRQPPNNMIHTTSSDHTDIQEDFRRLYMQIEVLKDKNQRMGNRQMVLRLAAMQEAAKTPNTLATTPTPTTTTNTTSPPAVVPVPLPPQQPSATTVVVTEKNGASRNTTAEHQQESSRRSSKSSRKYSDGVVMRPYVNNILANVTDKIVCATFHDDMAVGMEEGQARRESKDVNLLVKSVNTEESGNSKGRGEKDVNYLCKSESREGKVGKGIKDVNLYQEAEGVERKRKGNRRKEEESSSLTTSSSSTSSSSSSPRTDCGEGAKEVGPGAEYRAYHNPPSLSSPTEDLTSEVKEKPGPLDSLDTCGISSGSCGHCGSGNTSCGSSSSRSRLETTAGSPTSPTKSLDFRLSDFLQRKKFSSELSDRVCRSLECLDEGGARCIGGPVGGPGCCAGTSSDLGLEDRSVRSAHSTPRRSQSRRFREVRDPERARAFILYNLSDRATLTDEVTV